MIGRFNATHAVVYRRPCAFAGWPANYGLWGWGDEIVSIFVTGRLGSKNGNFHLEDPNQPFMPIQARSRDGGLTWQAEQFKGHIPGALSLSADEHVEQRLKAERNVVPSRDLSSLSAAIDFSNSETIVLAARTGVSGQPTSWFYVSDNRGHSWNGPYRFAGLEPREGLSARTDIIRLASHDALFMLTTTKENGEEGRVLCSRTRDGGLNFTFESFVWDGCEGYAIMPASTRLPNGTIYTVLRRSAHGQSWLEAYRSADLGQSWTYAGTPVQNTGWMGNPASLTNLADGRMLLLYGFRDPPFGIRGVISNDEGETWSDPCVLRDDAGEPDLGYPRALIRPDGKIVVVYYFNQTDHPERFIAASILDTPA